MDRRRFLAAGAATTAAPVAPAWAQTTARGGTPDARLRVLLDRFYDVQLDRNPEQATAAGLDTGVNSGRKSRLSDRSPGTRAARRAEARRELAQLLSIPAASLSPTSRIDRDVLRYALETEIEALGRGPLGASGDYLYSPYAVSQLTGAYQAVPDFLDNQHTRSPRGATPRPICCGCRRSAPRSTRTSRGCARTAPRA